jgi:serine/threonine protein kinase
MNINDIPADFDIRLGDFGNSLHISEASKYYQDFDIQTLSYRAPEVMFGVPFGPQIDVWSLGILLLELCLRKPLFIVRSREELVKAMEMKLSTPKLFRFAGGMYSDILMNNNDSIILPKINFPQHMLSVKRLLSKALLDVPADLVHFLAGMLHPDPDIRLTALDALQHPFLSSSLPIPMYLLNTKTNQRGAAAVGVAALRSKFTRQSPSVHNKINAVVKTEAQVVLASSSSSTTTTTTTIKHEDNSHMNRNKEITTPTKTSNSNNTNNSATTMTSTTTNSDILARIPSAKKSREIELLMQSNERYVDYAIETKKKRLQ